MALQHADLVRHEALFDGGEDGIVWIRHGIHAATAESTRREEVGQQQPPVIRRPRPGRGERFRPSDLSHHVSLRRSPILHRKRGPGYFETAPGCSRLTTER